MTKLEIVKEIRDKMLNKGYVFIDMGNTIEIENDKLICENAFNERFEISTKLSKGDLKFILKSLYKPNK